MKNHDDTPTCPICGFQRFKNATYCDGCWEVMSRLPGFLRRGPTARGLVRDALAEAEEEASSSAPPRAEG